MFAVEIICILIFLFIHPLFISLFSIIPPSLPLIGFASVVFLILIFIGIGLGSAKALMKVIDLEVTSHLVNGVKGQITGE